MIIGKAILIGGGKGIPCTLIVTTTPGASVTATLENKTVSVTANSSGIATLILKEEGIWTVTADSLGISASISVDVKNHRSLNLSLQNFIFKANEGLVGGAYYGDDASYIAVTPSLIRVQGGIYDKIIVKPEGGSTTEEGKTHNGMIIGASLNGNTGVGIDITPYRTLYFNVSANLGGYIGLISDTGAVANLKDTEEYNRIPSFVKKVDLPSSVSNETITIDVSTLSGTYFIGVVSGLGPNAKVDMNNIWLE